jgi:hypothetical protein
MVVYLHRKKSDNTVFYVGIGQDYRPYVTRGRSNLWNKVKDKYGIIVDVIHENINKDEAIKIEIELISKYGRIDIGTGCLTNLTDGGEGINAGYKHNDSFKEKARQRQLGVVPWNKGKKLTKEHTDKVSKSLKGRKAWNKGIPNTKETNDKIKKSSLKGGKHPSSHRVFANGIWYESIGVAGKAISNRTTVLNRCKSPKWNYFREGFSDPTP